MENTQNTADEMEQKAREAAQEAEENVEQAAETAEGKVHEIRSTAERRLHEVGDVAQHRIEDERDRVASRIEGVASRIRERGPNAGPAGMAGEQVAARMESAAGYLHGHQTAEIAGDFQSYVKAHPIQAVIGAGILGYILGRLMS